MSGLIYSKRQLEIYRFLERVGPCPLPALEALFGSRASRAVQRLRQERYIYSRCLNKIEFWMSHPFGKFDPNQQEVFAWFVARLEEKHGQYLGDNLCVSPNGTRLYLYPQKGIMVVMDDKKRKMKACLDDLKTMTLNECLKWEG